MDERPAVPPLGNPMFAGMVPQLKPFSPELVEDIFYDPAKKHYLCKAADGHYIALSSADTRRRLKAKGVSPQRDPLTGLSAVDDCIGFIQNHQNIQYAGPLAGYPCGLIDLPCGKLLVTAEARPFEIKEGSCDILLQFLDGLLGHDERQLDTFLFWWRGIMFEREKPRQALVLAGPASSGKSLTQQILTTTLGGRSAKPYRYLTGRTEFNSEMFGAEHLVIDDESSHTDFRSRESLGNQLKQIVVGSEHRLHAKGRDALMLSPFWVLSFSLNDEPENLQVLPRMEKSLEDKIILLQARYKPPPMPTGTAEERKAFWDELVSGASALLWDLREMEIPKELRSERYVVKSHHHCEVLRALSSISKESELLELIEANIKLPWEGTAVALDGLLRHNAPQQAHQLFSFSGACGQLLGRLMKLHPERVKYRRKGPDRKWEILKGTEGSE